MLKLFPIRLLLWAGRSAWNDRSVGIAEAAGSNPVPSTTRKPRPYIKNRIFNVVWKLKSNGYSDNTIQGYSKRLNMLSKHANLDNPETVKNCIARQDGWSNAYKEAMVNAYVHYVRMYNLHWEKPVYKRSMRLPNVPSTEQINKIIAKSGRKYSMVFSILRDTGLRPIELHRLTLRDIDLERGLIYPNSTKGGRPRVLKLKTATLAMLKEYIAKNNFGFKDKMFPTTKVASHVFMRIRNRLAKRLCEPELKKYRLYDLRHYFATMLYHRTKDILLVKEQLGHRRLETTLIYTHLVDFKDDEYTVRAAKTVQEACKLLESGFEYVTEMDNVKLFRKRK
jgi:integrase